MNTPTHEFVTVDMRGLKATLVARAQAERVSVSVLVRRAVERELGPDDVSPAVVRAGPAMNAPGSTVKLSLRLTRVEAEQLAAGARQAGLSRGAYLAGLLAGDPALGGGTASRPDRLAVLNASCAELSTLARDVHRLASLLRQGQGQSCDGVPRDARHARRRCARAPGDGRGAAGRTATGPSDARRPAAAASPHRNSLRRSPCPNLLMTSTAC
jgi:hypothetical protein